ncbi:Transforming growth factor beta regulator 1 [Micractinium conductrix]|uniref:Transforming growth factor beta regulator 1 n=1 Tax=Micractinium conductrix TaxID=554055 RepID=A0A2P6VCH7_9CHLO|nr:Transforming growth factor beta regulator 1 [Micractinium conductrix]|eukprot:PSC71800.1 Transforming growth factor beta regulator 1 [Micractinium conductrix]
MFAEATQNIATHRTDNLFQSLEQRQLTEEEQRIIDQRVALQRRMYEAYERQERARKVGELQEVCPGLSTQEAEQALEMCDGREDDAAAALVSDAAFRRRVKVACGLIAEPASAAVARKESAGTSRQPGWQAKPGPRPRLIDPATLGGNVFVGAFRGKGFKPPPKGRQAARKAAVAAAAGGSGGEQEEEEEEEEISDMSEQEGGAGDEEPQQEAQQEQQSEQQEQQFSAALQQAQQQAAQQASPAQRTVAAAAPVASAVLLWPSMGTAQAAAPAPPPAEPQRYVLVSTETLEVPTDSQLRSARRDLGEPSDSRLPGTTAGGGDGPHPTPVSAARSRPLPPAAAVEGGAAGSGEPAMPADGTLAAMARQLVHLDDGKALGLLQRMPAADVRSAVLERLEGLDAARAAACRALLGAPAAAAPAAAEAVAAQQQAAEEEEQGEGEQEEGEEAAPSTTRGGRGRRQAAARACRNVERAASSALSDSEATETEEEEPSSDEAASSDECESPPKRRQRAAAVEPRRARPARAAKQAAGAMLAAYAVASDDEGGDAALAAAIAAAEAASDDERPARAQRQRRGKRASPAPAVSEEPGSEAPSTAGKAAPARKKQRVDEQAAAAAAAAGATAAEPASSQQQGGSSDAGSEPAARQQGSRGSSPAPAAAAALPRVRAISATGHTCRGRVKQKSHKSADLVEAGSLRAEKGWYNAGYIFPEGFHSRTLFRSSVAIDQLCVHECQIIGRGGQFWPQPTFKVVALDRPDEPLIAKSCTGCWTGILKRINAEIEARRRAGENLPPPPKTAIAGPEYFGLNQPNIQEAVEDLDPDGLCAEYWAGKHERLAAAAGRPAAAGVAQRAQRAPRPPSQGGSKRGGGSGSSKRGRRRGGSDTEEEEAGDDEEQLVGSKWSAVNRSERYRKRLEDNGDDVSGLDKDNPLPRFIDPITMGAVVRPAISPYGHVAGLATWKVVLAEKQQCPFTNQPLRFEQLKLLTKTNIHLHAPNIVNGSAAGGGGGAQ